jgi:hypothetical protein
MELKMDQENEMHDPHCTHCLARAQEQAAAEEMNLAVLIALVPALTLTLFSAMGLF